MRQEIESVPHLTNFLFVKILHTFHFTANPYLVPYEFKEH